VAPLGALSHLKRIRRRLNGGGVATTQAEAAAAAPPPLEVLLCPMPGGTPTAAALPSPASPPALPPALAAVAAEFDLTPRSALVPAHPPPSAAALRPGGAWVGAWPAATRRADQRMVAGGKGGSGPQENGGAAAAAAPRPPAHAAAFLALARRAAADAGVSNAAVVVDPSGRGGCGVAADPSPSTSPPSSAPASVVAVAVDDRAAHPLRHAVMAVLDAIARRDLERWPPDGPPAPDK